jgi:hypothetical protein
MIPFSSMLNYICQELKFPMADKIVLTAFPDEILEKVFNSIKDRPTKGKLIAYFVTCCKNECTAKNIKYSFSLMHELNNNPEIQAIILEEAKQNHKDKVEKASFSGNSLSRPDVSTTFESRTNPTSKDGLHKPMAEWNEKDYLIFKINQLEGEIRRSCYADADSIIRFHPQEFNSIYATAPEISNLAEEQKLKPLADIMEVFVKKITPRIQLDAKNDYFLYKEAQKNIIIKNPIPVKKNILNFTKEQSVQEIATFKDLLVSDWFENIKKKNPGLAREKEALAEAMIKNHTRNINNPD